ncbi:MAG: hypothetical protein COU27_03090 [Candidatus Levybacteria bacterium CG10_big_fil_rev_8_21_14_0_10_36_7]|nr:MAG: hypothetical protein COU27_03090 [Candidatus Levybacteria bacterium CG10_big_fil_rev_8_21_14_0_10_36_7]
MTNNFSKQQISVSVFIIIVLVLLLVLFTYWQEPIEYLKMVVGRHSFWGPIAYIVLALTSVVLAPFTIVPLIPVASAVFGPLEAAIYSVVGWGAGGIIAFLIARHVGRPILAKFISLESIKKFEDYIPKEVEFLYVFVLRMIIPVDGLSYALGLFSTINLWKYSLATVLGILPMSFVFSYAGGALIYRDLTNLIIYISAGAVLFILIFFLFYKIRLNNFKNK